MKPSLFPFRLIVAVVTAAAPIAAQVAPTAPVVPPSASWEHAGSDIPADPAWVTGTLANGLRYAVRRNATPPGTISIRVRMDVGGLMEADDEQGWSHLMEHMAFRGSAGVADGEGPRIWQRLGASFGSDSNAATTLTATTYQLDLPRNDPASFAEAMRVVAGMMRSATIDPAALATERKVVLAERSLRLTPLATKTRDAEQAVVQAGLKASHRDVIGPATTLQAVTAPQLRSYYRKWYRPSRAVVVIVGDADPVAMARGIETAFGDWHGTGPEPASPDWGSVKKPASPVGSVVDPQAYAGARIVWVTPHDETPWTIARQQRQFTGYVALGILRNRLDTAAQAGGALSGVRAGQSQTRHLNDQLSIGITPQPGQLPAALDQVFAVVNRLVATPPGEDEIDAAARDILTSFTQSVAAQTTATSAGLVNGFVADVDNGDVSAAPDFYRTLFAAQRRALTPAAIRAWFKDATATDPRLIASGPDAAALSTPALASALTSARHVAGGASAAVRAVSLTELKLPAVPGIVAARSTIADLGIERVRFANGVTLAFKKTPYEANRIQLQVKIGNGLLDYAPGATPPSYTSSLLSAAGIGPFTRDELVRVTAGRQIGWSARYATDGLTLGSATTASDLADDLRFIAASVTQMRFAEPPLNRFKNSFAASYQALFSQPLSAAYALGTPYLYGGDQRFRAVPPSAEVAALTLPALERFWQGELGKGPVEITAVGDLDPDALIAAVGRTLGALPARDDVVPTTANLVIKAPAPAVAPVILHHRGDPDQGIVTRVFATFGGWDDLPAARAITVAAQVVQTRLIEGFREQEGGTYSPQLAQIEIWQQPSFGEIQISAQVSLAQIGNFNAALDRVLADLAAKGPDADELARAKAVSVSGMQRAQVNNAYWLSRLSLPLDDAKAVDAIRTSVTGRQAVTAADVQRVVARYLTPARSFTIEVLPEAAAAPAK